MKGKSTNLSASALARLRNVAREKNTDYQLILRRYAIERLLHRLSISPYRNQFVLKGAMLFTAWLEDPFQETSTSLVGESATPEIKADSGRSATNRRPDWSTQRVWAPSQSARISNMAACRQDEGVSRKNPPRADRHRLRRRHHTGSARVGIPVNGRPTPKAYPKETVVAEKFQASPLAAPTAV